MEKQITTNESMGGGFKKYGKTYSNMWKFKDSLTKDNNPLLNRNQKVLELYSKQPMRKYCKVCNGENHRWEFYSHGVKYYCCNTCGHINGEFEDTEEFTKALYESDAIGYGDDYQDVNLQEYNERVDTIYLPKAEFLRDTICCGDNLQNMRVVDIGAGAGHNVAAMQKIGFSAVGVEVDQHQVEFASHILPPGSMIYCPSDKICEYIKTVDADCISFIYVLEHVQNLVDVFEAFISNANIEYLYFSVPMFSCSTILESITDRVFPRVLAAEHTHIFTNESIEYICHKYSLQPIGVWRFGADIADLLRTITVELEMKGNSALAGILKKQIVPVMDDLQSILDSTEFCSDIHIVLKK